MLTRRRLDCTASATQVMRAMRGRPGLIGLLGGWNDGSSVVAFDPVRVLGPETDPFDAIAAPACGSGPPGFGGGWIGVWGYPLGGRIERLPAQPPSPRPTAPYHLAYYDTVLRLDGETWWFETLAPDPDDTRHPRLYGEVVRALREEPASAAAYECGPFAMTPTGDGHRRAVARTIEHIEAGDIFQANICLRLEAAYRGDPLDLFCAGVEALRPEYSAFVRTADGAVASLSPELFLRRTGRSVVSSPIKGTAPLTADAATLVGSSKNRAENIMIVDLMRNDLGRVCRPGSIRVATVRPRRHVGVWHLVSDVTGELRDGVDDADLLRATFPPGSVTGAPKVRAMEIINTEEATGREAYTGAIGYVSPHAGLELNVAIRTFEFAQDRVWLGVGGGIVVDSTPGDELRECLVKVEPLLAAVGGRLESVPGTDAPDPDPVGASNLSLGLPDRTCGRVADPGLGLFETLLVLAGRPTEPRAHVERLAGSVAELYAVRLDVERVVGTVMRAAARLDGPHRMRVVVRPDSPEQVTVEAEPEPGPGGPWHLVPALLPGGLGRHKWRDRSVLDLLRPAGVGQENEPLLVDVDGAVLETGRASVFIVTDEGVHTPSIDRRILPGVTRSVVLDLLREARVPTFERTIDLGELDRAEEVFVANAVRGVHPVASCDGVGAWPTGPTTTWLAGRLAARRGAPGSPATPARRAPPGEANGSVLLIDNYDSFVYNLAQYVQELGADATVVRNDALSVEDVAAACAAGDVSHLIVSPGPGRPEDAGISNALIARLGPTVPTLGVCLGHQCIGLLYGARVVRANGAVHGKPSLVHHDRRGVFAGLTGPLVSARYHSLVLEDVPECLVVTARTASGIVMGVRHRTYPVEGVQVHPESILTPWGHGLVENFLRRR